MEANLAFYKAAEILMDYLQILIQMLMIFGVVLVGFVAARLGVWGAGLSRQLAVYVINVSMPCLILASVMGRGLVFEADEVLTLVLVSLLNYILLIGGAFLVSALWKVGDARRGLQRFMLSFGNVSFIGFPVVAAIFGERAVFYASVLNIPFNLLIFTVGVSFITGGQNGGNRLGWKLFFSPCVVASIIAIVLALCKVQTPEPVAQWFHLLGDMTTPCALLIIGASLSQIPVRDMLGTRFVYGISALRLLFVPIVVAGVFRLLGIDSFVSSVAVVLSAMPVATNGVMFCFQYGRDERVMTQGLFISTLFSVLSIPVLVALLQWILPQA